MNGIYQPKGRAGEYGEYAVNIYTGCTHGCTYCYAAKMAKRYGKDFEDVRPRPGIVEQVKKDMAKLAGKTIHLCFTCDPYPAGIDTSVTRDVIADIKDGGGYVQILTKNPTSRDFDLLGSGDWFGVTITGADECEPHAMPGWERIEYLKAAHDCKIDTWISCEPVLSEPDILDVIKHIGFANEIKIGKLNHMSLESMGLEPIHWAQFGKEVERLCIERGRDYLIKEDLRKEMEQA